MDIPGLRFPEGPRWRENALWFSDQLGGAIHRVSESGEHQIMAELDNPSGLGWTPDGALLTVSMHDPALIQIVDGVPEELVDLRPFTPHVNDMYVDPQGRAYIDAFGDAWGEGELLLVIPGEAPIVAAAGLSFPNGIALTPDGATLIVSETGGARLTAFDVDGDGLLSGRRVWAEIAGSSPDGLCLDAEGAVWFASVRAGEFVRVREGGEVTDRIDVGSRWAMACALGGADGRTLFLCTAETRLRDYLAGNAVGQLETRRATVPGVERP
jgi:sugar lactone lactonase YvrE